MPTSRQQESNQQQAHFDDGENQQQQDITEHFDPYAINTFRPEDPRYLEREIAMQRESRAAAGRRHPAGMKLRVADFWRLYYQHQGSAEKRDPESVDALTARKSSRARSASFDPQRSTSQSPVKSVRSEREREELEEAGKSMELNAKVPAGGNATCIGIVDGGLTILVGRDNGRVAVVDGLKGELIQDIDVALAARPRENPRRREVSTALKLMREDEEKQDNNNNNDNNSRSIAAPGENNDSNNSQQQQQQENKSNSNSAKTKDDEPLCTADAQEKALEKRDIEGERTEAEVISSITAFTPRGLGRPMFLVGAESGRIFLFDATTLMFLSKVGGGDKQEQSSSSSRTGNLPTNKIAEMRWLSEGQVGPNITEIIGRNEQGDMFVLEIEATETPDENDTRNITTTMKVSKKRDAVPPKHQNHPPPRMVSMVALGGTVWAGDEGGSVWTLDPEDLGRVQFASEDFSLYAVSSDSDNPAVNALAVGGSFTYVAVESKIHVLPLSGMPKDRIPLSTLTAHNARVVSLDFDHATGRLWSRDASGVVACYDGTSKSGFALRTTMQLPAGGPVVDIKFCSYETHVRLWTLASNGLNRQWCSGFAAGSTDATNQAALNEADIEVDGARTNYWTEAVSLQCQIVDRRRLQGATALEEYDRTRTLSEFFDIWNRFRRLKQFLRIQPLHAKMLTGQANLSLMGGTFRRWLHFRLQKRINKIQQGGARLLLQRIEEERMSAYFRRLLRFKALSKEKKEQESAAAIFGNSSGRLSSGLYFEKWKAFAVRRQMRKQKQQMAEIVFQRWQSLARQRAFDAWSRVLAKNRARRLAVAAVQVLGSRLNQVRLTNAWAAWSAIREKKQLRNRQKHFALTFENKENDERRRRSFHNWIHIAATQREERQAHSNHQLTDKVAKRQEEYMANQAHVDRVKLLKSLRASVAQLQKETEETKQKIVDAEKKADQVSAQVKTARSKAASTNPNNNNNGVIAVTQRLSREVLIDPGEDVKLVTAIFKEDAASNAKAIQISTTHVRSIVDHGLGINNNNKTSSRSASKQPEQTSAAPSTAEGENAAAPTSSSSTAVAENPGSSSASTTTSTIPTVPHLAVDVDAFGEKIGRSSADQLVEHVRRLSLAGLATSNDSVKEVVDENSTNFLVQEGDNLALCAKRLYEKPPAIPVAAPAASSRSGRKASPAKKKSSSPTKKAATSSSKAPAGGRAASSSAAKKPATSTTSTTAKKPAAKTTATTTAKRPVLKK